LISYLFYFYISTVYQISSSYYIHIKLLIIVALNYYISNDIIIYHSHQIEISNKKGVTNTDTPFKIVYFTQFMVYPFSSEISFFTVHFTLISLVHDPGFEQVEFKLLTIYLGH